MDQIHYQVAGHFFTIETEDKDGTVALLPSYAPFVCGKPEKVPVFCLSVVSEEQYLIGDEIHRFNWDGSSYVIYKGKEGYSFQIFPDRTQLSYLLRADAAFSKGAVYLPGNKKYDQFILNNCLMMMYAFATASMGTLMIHASVTCQGGEGYLFLGKSGTGKSTHSGLWMKHIPGSSLLNDDNPVVRLTDNQVIVSGSPWSGKTPCYRNMQLPVGAFVKLRQAPENKISKSHPSLAFAGILASCSIMTWDSRIFDGICNTVTEVVEKIPCYVLDCLPDEEAALLCYQTVTNE